MSTQSAACFLFAGCDRVRGRTVPGWISELLILVGLAVLAFAVIVGNAVYDFFWGEQYVILHFDRVMMLWIGGLTALVGILLRLTDTRPKRRRRTTPEY